MKKKLLILIFISVGLLGIALLCMPEPIAQWQSYHQFVDARKMFGIPNFWNVVSNLFFCIVGALGIWKVPNLKAKERAPLLMLFLGVFLTGLGSAYYHLDPHNRSLIWDRIPMTMVFASMLSLIIMYRIDFQAGFWLLIPLVILGVWTVLYWSWTDDLRPYALMQYFSLVVMMLILYLFPGHYPPTSYIVWAFAFYALAKVFEWADCEVYHFTGILSGHTLKHIVAAMGAYLFVAMLQLHPKEA